METELKFILPPEGVQRAASEWLPQGRTREIVSTYFDTPAHDLRKAGAALRLRRTGDAWVQTLKSGGAGAVARFEDERPVAGGELEPDVIPQKALAALSVKSPRELRPVFETRVTRRVADLMQGEAHMEIALDVGSIHAGEAQAPLLELELELKSGGMADLLEAGRRALELPGARLGLTSKAERGYRLASGVINEAVKFEAPTLDEAASVAAGFQALAMAALQQLAANAELLRLTPSPEAVHQARVALRRLRTFAAAFEDPVSDERAAGARAIMKRLTAIFEDARALDVLQAETVVPHARHEPGAADFGHGLLAARGRVYREVQAAVRDAAFGRDVFELAAWVLCGSWLNAAALAPDGGERLDAAADRLLAHRWKVMRRRGRKLDWSDPSRRHKLRIQGKKLRYLLEALGDHRVAKPWLKRLKALQDELGELNDIATAPAAARLAYAEAAPEAAFAAGSMIGERRAELTKRIKRARRAFRRLVAKFSDVTTPGRRSTS